MIDKVEHKLPCAPNAVSSDGPPCDAHLIPKAVKAEGKGREW